MIKHHAVDNDCRESDSAFPVHTQIFAHLGLTTDSGNKTSWAERCRSCGLDPSTVTRMLEAFDQVLRTAPAVSIELMTLTELCDHIEQTHHRRLQQTLSQLDELIGSAAEGKEDKIHELFRIFRTRTLAHLQAESGILFPLIRQIEAESPGSSITHHSLRATMTKMENDHNEADEALAELHTLARAAQPSLGQAISRLESDLHEQIYKENHALFPKALALAGRG